MKELDQKSINTNLKSPNLALDLIPVRANGAYEDVRTGHPHSLANYLTLLQSKGQIILMILGCPHQDF